MRVGIHVVGRGQEAEGPDGECRRRCNTVFRLGEPLSVSGWPGFLKLHEASSAVSEAARSSRWRQAQWWRAVRAVRGRRTSASRHSDTPSSAIWTIQVQDEEHEGRWKRDREKLWELEARKIARQNGIVVLLATSGDVLMKS